MSLAVVFDSAGTLLKTVRAVVEIQTETLYLDSVETTLLTFEDPDRLLVLLNLRSGELQEADGSQLLSAYLTGRGVTFGISCGRKIIDANSVGGILYADTKTRVSQMQKAIAACRETVSKESELFAMNTGVIINTRTREIEYGIAAAGHPFPGVRDLISALHQKGVAVFIASGDRTEKLELVADNIGIPRNRVHGVATPVTKAQVVTSLKQDYDVVIMVGDGINDLSAMRAADISVLTLQQKGERPEILLRTAGYIIHDIRETAGIVDEVLNQ
ncbi:MAG: HAD-IC family P-type ATPase [Methanocorpusculum sp.]|nr:HAD-IC family P-type ATPase [Methanocorpusculum sp.]